MKKFAVALLASLLTICSAYAGPIKGLVDIATGKEVPDADLRYAPFGGGGSGDVFKGSNNVYAAGTVQYMPYLNVSNGLWFFGVAITNVDTNAVVYADGTQPLTADWNIGGHGLSGLTSLLPMSSNAYDIGSQTMPFRTVNASNFNVVGSSISFNGEVAFTKSGSDVVVHGGLKDTNGTTYASLGSNTFNAIQYMPQGIMLNSNVFFNFGYYNGTSGVMFVEGGTTTNWLLFR